MTHSVANCSKDYIEPKLNIINFHWCYLNQIKSTIFSKKRRETFSWNDAGSNPTKISRQSIIYPIFATKLITFFKHDAALCVNENMFLTKRDFPTH